MDRKISCRAAFDGVCKTIKKKRQENYFDEARIAKIDKSMREVENGEVYFFTREELKAMADICE